MVLSQVGAVLAVGSAAAHADVITTYSLADATLDGGIVSGLFEVDQTTGGSFVSGSIAVTGASHASLNGSYGFNLFAGESIVFDYEMSDYLYLEIGSPPERSGTYDLADIAIVADYPRLTYYRLTSGTLTASTPTLTFPGTTAPEPSGAFVAATGLLALGGLRRQASLRR